MERLRPREPASRLQPVTIGIFPSGSTNAFTVLVEALHYRR